MRLFPEGFQESLEQLLKVLSQSPNSYAIEVYRYEGETDYRAKVRLTYQADATEFQIL